MKGIILAGGNGTRLHPITLGVCKQLIPIYDKPMIYYPLSILMLVGIKDILIISTPIDIIRFKNIFKDGHQLGLNISYKEQLQPNGLAEAFILGEEFIGNDNVALILGDNIFFGHGLPDLLKKAKNNINLNGGATIFSYYVTDPSRYGIINLDENGTPISIEEKPKNPKSNYAVTGLYFYDNHVINIAKKLVPSPRGEIEITDINKIYLNNKNLNIEPIGRGFTWMDTGTPESLLEAAEFIAIIEKRQGLKIACIEEIAYRLGYINKKELLDLASYYKNSYGEYIRTCAKETYVI